MRLTIAAAIMALAATVTGARSETTDCVEVTSLPAVIDAQGVHCFKQNLSTNINIGSAIRILVNNVTLDLNGFKLGGLGAGSDTIAYGISFADRKNVTIKNGIIRGFIVGISAGGSESSGHIIKEISMDSIWQTGVILTGSDHVVMNNRFSQIGHGDRDTATAINLNNTRDSLVVRNLTSDISAPTATAIWARDNSKTLEIRNNTIFQNDKGYGIRFFNVSDSVVVGNVLINNYDPLGSTGISMGGTNSGNGCIGNVVHGFSSSIENCNYVDRNEEF